MTGVFLPARRAIEERASPCEPSGQPQSHPRDDRERDDVPNKPFHHVALLSCLFSPCALRLEQRRRSLQDTTDWTSVTCHFLCMSKRQSWVPLNTAENRVIYRISTTSAPTAPLQSAGSVSK